MVKKWIKYIETSPYKNELLKIINDIENGNTSKYQPIKMKGNGEYFRIRKGKIRIVFTGRQVVGAHARGRIYKSLGL